MTTNKEDVRYLYLRDSDSNRVVTVARKLSEDRKNVIFAFSVNRPTKKELTYNGVYQTGDQFNKARGRTIALGRLNKNKEGEVFTLALKEDCRPIETILDFLAYGNNKNIPRCVQKVALQEYHNSAYDFLNTAHPTNTLSSAEEEYSD